MIVPITSIVAGLLAMLMLVLTVQVSVLRARAGLRSGDLSHAVFGDAGDPRLRGAIRAFGNFIEYAPIVVILLGLMEWQRAPDWLVWTLGLAFVAGRIVHALSMSLKPLFPPPRGLAMLATYAAILVPGFWLLIRGLGTL